ncbi:formimidoylglutamase [Taylorella equigenitalis 14/56]|uniref:Formimidoylglutamase n=1 Tax=Taylorella equigenitalis 14/56 TaxID=1091497 RepID=I7IZ25_9BURK|nr:formimidoylglutamase [Taylorella equigenitalis]CCG18114.1 formimidoylglutamase [Taylorella equigenitalis 14/56]
MAKLLKDFEWTGRSDGEGEAHARIHNCITTEKPADNFIVGFASDEGVGRNHGRIGAAQAPNLIRKQLAGFAVHKPLLIQDLGTVSCEDSNLENAQTLLAETILPHLSEHNKNIVLGGGHEVAFGSLLATTQYARSQNKKLGIINFDAHFDLREPPKTPEPPEFHVFNNSLKSGQPPEIKKTLNPPQDWTHGYSTSGTPFYQGLHAYDDAKYMVLGIATQSNTKVLFDRAKEMGVSYIFDYEMNSKPIAELISAMDAFIDQVDFLHISIDLDVFPQAHAPGVSAPAPFGVGYNVIHPLLRHIFNMKKVILLEIAELNPNFDIDSRTAKLAAHIVYEFVHGGL